LRRYVEGWGGVIAKTVSLEADYVNNVTPRYAKLKVGWCRYGSHFESLLPPYIRGSSSLFKAVQVDTRVDRA